MTVPLVLSLFPGIGLLDRAFEESGFCIVRGPDVIWGGDVMAFHPPTERFDGIIGGPPCQAFSQLRYLQEAQGREMRFGNLIPEFERCVAEARPGWFLMENVLAAPQPEVPGYVVCSYRINNRWVPDRNGFGAEQSRLRVFSFGTPDGRELSIEVALFEAPLSEPTLAGCEGVPGQRGLRQQAVLSSARALPVRIGGSGKVKVTAPGARGTRALLRADAEPCADDTAPGAVTSSDGGTSVRMSRYTVAEACVLQGLPADFLDDAPFTVDGKRKAIANGVPLPLGRAIARAVKRAMGTDDGGDA